MKKVSLLVISVIISSIAFSQTCNFSGEDKKVHFGFNLGINYSNIQAKSGLPENATITNGEGLSFGSLVDISISQNMLVSTKVEIASSKGHINFQKRGAENSTYDIFPVSLGLMTHLAYRLGNSKNAPYIFSGPSFRKYAQKAPSSTSTFINNSNIAIDFGIGLENKNKFFKLAPEIRYSYGLLNINENPALKDLHFNSISLVLNFE